MGVPDFICSPTEKWPARSTLLPLRVPPWPLPGLSLVAVSLGTVPLADFQPLSSPCVCTWTDVWPQASPSWLAPQIAHPQNKSPSSCPPPEPGGGTHPIPFLAAFMLHLLCGPQTPPAPASPGRGGLRSSPTGGLEPLPRTGSSWTQANRA